MKNVRIIFDGTEPIALPDGNILGIVGEHNAVQLVITLPENMVEGMTYHTVEIGGMVSARIDDKAENVDGAYRVGNVIYQPLTATYTTQRIVDVSVTAYRQIGDEVQVVDKTPTVYGLRFDGGTPLKAPGGLAAEVAALEVRTDALEGDVAELAEEIKEAGGIKTVTVLPDDPDDDEIVYLNAEDSGFYRWDGSDWARLTDDGEGLEALANIVSNMGDQLDKLAVVEKYSDLSEETDALAAFVYGLDGGQKSLADYDPETDADTPLYVAESMTYDPNATIDSGVIIFEGTESDVVLTLLPVYTYGTVDPVYGGLDMILETNETNPSAYMPLITSDFDEETLTRILEDYEITVPTGADVGVLFVCSFDAISGSIIEEGTAISGSLEFAEGWNIIIIVDGSELTVHLSTVDPNNYLNIGTFSRWEQTEPNLNYLLDAVVFSKAVDKRGVYVKTNGEWIDPYRTDDSNDVTMLGFETYSDLVVRDDVTNSGGIQDVPVFLCTGVGDICKLSDEAVNVGDYIALSEVRQSDTGSPLRIIRTSFNGVYKVYCPFPFTSIVSRPAGWSDENGDATSAPDFSGFTPDTITVGSTDYTSVDDLTDYARSALRSMSQCINVSADAMGTIVVPDDAVEQFAGTIEPNHKYYFAPGDDTTITMPSVDWSEGDAQFVMYLYCDHDYDFAFPSGTYFVGGEAPNTETGAHKLIGCWLRNEGAWAIGGIDYSEVS